MLLLSTIRDDLVKLRLLLGNFLGQLNSWGGYNPSHAQVANPPIAALSLSRHGLGQAATAPYALSTFDGESGRSASPKSDRKPVREPICRMGHGNDMVLLHQI